MGNQIDILIEWAKQKKRWPLLLMLAIPLALFPFSQNYYELSFKDTFCCWFFWVSNGLIFFLSGTLYWAVSYQELCRLWVCIPLTFFGIVLILGGLWQLTPLPLPEDKLFVAIARFTPVSSVAKEEADNIAHRIKQELCEKQREGAPLEIRGLLTQVDGLDEQARHRSAILLCKSRKGNAHIILWGEVRKDEKELYVEPHFTVARQMQNARIEERNLKNYTNYEPEHIDFKKRLSNEIADIVTLVYGLAYYKTGRWDQAIQILDHVQSNEGYLYKGLCLHNRAEQSVNPQKDLQAAIEIYEKILGPDPLNLTLQSDLLTWTAYTNRANVIVALSLFAQPKESLAQLKYAVNVYRIAFRSSIH